MKLKLNDLIDEKHVVKESLITNQVVDLYLPSKEGDTHCLQRVWKGMSWNIPPEFRNLYVRRIFGSIQEKIEDSDIINIELVSETF